MACLCQLSGMTMMACLRRYLGVSSSKGWDQEAHRALYQRISTMLDVQSNREQTAEQIRSVGYGAEPDITGVYAGSYPTRYIPSGDPFWTCIGVTRDEAARQASGASGPYYDAMIAVMRNVRGTESGSPDKSEGTPWWLWVLLGVGVVGGAYLVLR